jgi:hypothetical protein
MLRALLLIPALLLLGVAVAAEENTESPGALSATRVQSFERPAPGVCPLGTPVAKDYARDTTICVKPLDDPANPYRGKYGPIDRWVWEHAAPWEAAQDVKSEYQQTPEGAVIDGSWPMLGIFPVDMAGWLVPFVEFQRNVHNDSYLSQESRTRPAGLTVRQYHAHEQERSQRANQRSQDWGKAPPEPGGFPPYMLAAMGEMPAEVYAEWEHHFHAWQSDQYPPIPAWLAENSPLAAVFLPDSTILAYGPLGLHYQPGPNSRILSSDWDALNQGGGDWYHYDAQGKLLEQRKASAEPHRWMASWSGAAEMQTGNMTTYPGFMVESRYATGSGEQSTNEPTGAYLWDGTPLGLDAPAPDYPAGVGQLILRSQLLRLYRTQLRSGRTMRTSLSPYAGQPDGPVVADATPKPLPATIPQMGFQSNGVKTRPLDDPANPYREQYTQWDRWIFEHIGKMDPLEQAHYNDQFNRQQAARDEARRAKLPEPSSSMEPYQRPPDSPWRHVTARLDEDGWLLPLALTPAEGLFLDRDRREPYVFTGPNVYIGATGEMPPEAWAEFQAARDAARRAHYARIFPALPAWLKTAPVASLVFLPDSSIITWGERGSYRAPTPDPNWPADRRPYGKNGGTQAWFRYSASGKLLGQTSGGEARLQWLPLTFPGAQAVLDAAIVDGHEAHLNDGYLLVYAGPLLQEKEVEGGRKIMHLVSPTPALLAAYDWDGKPVDYKRPLQRLDGYGVTVRWEDIAE